MNTDPIRDQLWASVYAEHIRKGLIWFNAQKQADLAVQAYDKRPATEGPAP